MYFYFLKFQRYHIMFNTNIMLPFMYIYKQNRVDSIYTGPLLRTTPKESYSKFTRNSRHDAYKKR